MLTHILFAEQSEAPLFNAVLDPSLCQDDKFAKKITRGSISILLPKRLTIDRYGVVCIVYNCSLFVYSILLQ